MNGKPMRHEAPLVLWGKEQGNATRLPWSWALERIQAAEEYWLATAGGRGPTVRPVWGLWIEERLLLSVGSSTHLRNLRTSDRIAVHLGDAHEVVIIEGRARLESDADELARVVEPYNQKYDWNWPEGDGYGPMLGVDPSVVIAWIAPPNEDARTVEFPVAAGKWVFTGDGS